MHAIPFEKNKVSALTDLNKALVRGITEFAKDRLCARNRGGGIPLSNHDQGRRFDSGRLPISSTRQPILASVLDSAVWRADNRRRLLGADRIGGQYGRRPRFEPCVGHQVLFLFFGRAILQAAARLLHRPCLISSKWSSTARCWRFACPGRRIKHQAIDFVAVLRRVSAHGRGTPGPAHQVEFGHSATRQDMINSRPYILDCYIGSDDRWILGRWPFHLGWAGGTTVASQINEIDIIATLCDVIHPRDSIQSQIECMTPPDSCRGRKAAFSRR